MGSGLYSLKLVSSYRAQRKTGLGPKCQHFLIEYLIQSRDRIFLFGFTGQGAILARCLTREGQEWKQLVSVQPSDVPGLGLC